MKKKYIVGGAIGLCTALLVFAAIALGLQANQEAPDTVQAADVANCPEYNTLEALVAYARRRLGGAAAYGPNIRTGRHHPADLAAFEQAILRAEGPYHDCAEYELSRLIAAIGAFRNSIIDPYNRYRPFLSTIAHGEDVPRARHLRAAWIATVINIDWPSVAARGTTAEHVDLQKLELRQRFDEMYDLGMNAVIFQISPTADAFHASEVSPWSAWLTGETNFTGVLLDSQGNAFDPLQYAIDLARARNMELHAWFNPYRITHNLLSYTRGAGIVLSSTGEIVESLADIRAEWEGIPGTAFNILGQYVAPGEGRYVLCPGVPAARQWIVRRVMEVVENYDIDAIHFDDYFYPANWNDDLTFARYNTTHPNTPEGRANWRRENTETLIREVNAAIKEAAPWVRFGISPGGVWISGDGSVGLDGGGVTATTGSGSTTTWSNYHSSFADTRRWVIENFIDYITPQIYWDWSLAAAPYGPIADWWARLVRDFGPQGHLRNSQGEYTHVRLYIGLGLYRMVENPPPKWRNAYEYQYEGKRTFLRQEHFNLGNPNIAGSMIFAQNHVRPGRGSGLWDTMSSLRDGAWRYPALVPAINHLGGTAPSPPDFVVLGDYIIWANTEQNGCQLVTPRYFVIYRNQGPIDINNPAHIYAIVPAEPGRTLYYRPLSMSGHWEYNFAVTAVNRLHQESELAE